MNQKERRIAETLAQRLAGDDIHCPGCGANYDLANNRYQVKCGKCNSRITVYVQENSERPLAVNPPPPVRRNVQLKDIEGASIIRAVSDKILNRGKDESKSERFKERTKK